MFHDDIYFSKAEVYLWFRDPPSGPERSRRNRAAINRYMSQHLGTCGPMANLTNHLTNCAMYRKMMTHPEFREDYIRRHRRIIGIMRTLRLELGNYRSGIASKPYYVEPTSNHVLEEDLPKISAMEGIEFEEIKTKYRSNVFTFLRNRIILRRPKGLWNSERFDDDDERYVANEVMSVFRFSDPRDVAMFEEEYLTVMLSR